MMCSARQCVCVDSKMLLRDFIFAGLRLLRYSQDFVFVIINLLY